MTTTLEFDEVESIRPSQPWPGDGLTIRMDVSLTKRQRIEALTVLSGGLTDAEVAKWFQSEHGDVLAGLIEDAKEKQA